MQSMVVAHQTMPAFLPMVAAHISRVVAVVVANDLVTMWLVIGCLQLVFLDQNDLIVLFFGAPIPTLKLACYP